MAVGGRVLGFGGRGAVRRRPSVVITLPRNRLFLIAILSLLWASHACAGPPFVTDDPEPVEQHHWEVYLSSVIAHDVSDTTGTLPHVEINYGAAPNLQLHLIAPYAFDRPAGQPALRGLGDIELGAKYRFVEETERRPMVGIFPLLELPTGDATRGLGGGHYRLFLPVWFQKSWGSGWTSYGGGGYWLNPGAGNRDYWLFGWEVQRDLSERLTVGGEIVQTTAPTVGAASDLSFNLGGQINFDEGHHLLFSAGRSFRGSTQFMGYLGYQWTFGR
jgi:hypothetical protein